MERSVGAPDVPRSLRTEWNVRDADAILVLLADEAQPTDPGTRWAREVAEKLGKPVLIARIDDERAADQILSWLRQHRVEVLGVGGPSERTEPGIEEAAFRLLDAVLVVYLR